MGSRPKIALNAGRPVADNGTCLFFDFGIGMLRRKSGVKAMRNEEGKREVARLKNVYENYRDSGVPECWNATNPGSRAMLHERRDVRGLEEKKAGLSDG